MFYINEAIEFANSQGKKIKKKDISARLWPNSSESGRRMNMASLCGGKMKRIDHEWVGIICDMCGCTPNFLFNYGKTNN